MMMLVRCTLLYIQIMFEKEIGMIIFTCMTNPYRFKGTLRLINHVPRQRIYIFQSANILIMNTLLNH